MDARTFSELCNIIAALLIGLVLGMIIGYEICNEEK